MVAPHVLDVAVVRALARDLAQVPAHAGVGVAKRERHLEILSSSVLRAKRPSPTRTEPAPTPRAAPSPETSERSSSFQNNPAGAMILDSSNGTSVSGSGSRARIAFTH